MTPEKQREIVIEFEKVQTIRKQAVTTLSNCPECSDTADFVGRQIQCNIGVNKSVSNILKTRGEQNSEY